MSKTKASKARTYDCSRCGTRLAREDRRRRAGDRLVVENAELTVSNGRTAPTLRCNGCGLRTILIEGRM